MQARGIISEHPAPGLFRDSRPAAPEAEKLEALFRDSLPAYPANPQAHQDYVNWLRDSLKMLYYDQEQQRQLEAKLRAAMEQWSESLPEEIEPRLW
ncbi:hypothetical protein [Roseimaritima ulvae]|uniref:Uncharacterized protein n=1 Tax=Roseimaritima ulvae TaxID=980254 RepID=A0A5B9QVA5_9BACT|nr:hypothetical protein [Roseimaritima ulvae]QEG42968.1 hypothetical protein UC8_50110 [Roseimaritima ulvae]